MQASDSAAADWAAAAGMERPAPQPETVILLLPYCFRSYIQDLIYILLLYVIINLYIIYRINKK